MSAVEAAREEDAPSVDGPFVRRRLIAVKRETLEALEQARAKWTGRDISASLPSRLDELAADVAGFIAEALK